MCWIASNVTRELLGVPKGLDKYLQILFPNCTQGCSPYTSTEKSPQSLWQCGHFWQVYSSRAERFSHEADSSDGNVTHRCESLIHHQLIAHLLETYARDSHIG